MFKLKVPNKAPDSQEEAKKLQTVTISSFFSKLFYFQTALKFLHLKVSGNGAYAAHVALGDLYDTLSGLTDTLVESAQCEEILTIKHEALCSCDVSNDLVKELWEYVENNRYVFTESFQRNLIDTLQEKIAITKYKLKFLA